MRFPCGTYSSWTANLHAIALTLENLRAIDRYGVTLTHQQYAGFKMLPAADSRATVRAPLSSATIPKAGSSATATALEAALILASIAVRSVDYVLENFECYQVAYRLAARNCHPDQTTGQEREWADLQRAKTVLESYFESTTV